VRSGLRRRHGPVQNLHAGQSRTGNETGSARVFDRGVQQRDHRIGVERAASQMTVVFGQRKQRSEKSTPRDWRPRCDSDSGTVIDLRLITAI
jgi:hypothetical protein